MNKETISMNVILFIYVSQCRNAEKNKMIVWNRELETYFSRQDRSIDD